MTALSSLLTSKHADLAAEVNAAFDRLVAAVEARREAVLKELAAKEAAKQATLGKKS